MLLPGFTADRTLINARTVFSGVGIPDSDSSVTAAACYDVDHLPVCYNRRPAILGRCCDHTHERICNGQRIAICTFTDCTGIRDTNTSILTQ